MVDGRRGIDIRDVKVDGHDNDKQFTEIVEVYVESDAMKSVEISERTADDGDEEDGAAATSEPATPSNGSSSASEDDDYAEDDEEDRRHASIGKKLWKFFTT